jgi:hypothetical protein
MKRIKSYILVAQVFLAFACVMKINAQTPQANSRKAAVEAETRSADSLKIENLILLANAAPPEVAADLLLTVVATQTALTKVRRQELIEEAFRFAGNAREPVKRKSWSPIVDTRSGLKHAAFELELDKLSLQTKAVMQMMALDKTRARAMFADITLPKLPELTCEDSLSYDVESYYHTAVAVSENCFNENERKAEAHIQFLSERLGNIKAVPHVAAAAKALIEAKVSADEFTLLVNTFVDVLGHLSTEARSFAFAIGTDRLIFSLSRLVQKLKEQDRPTVDLSRAIRSFLVKQFSGEVCIDAPWLEGRAVKLPDQLKYLNGEFAQPIVTDDIRPLSFGAAAKDRQFWTMPREKQLLMLAKDLRFGGTETQLTLAERQTDEWRKKLNDYLDVIDQWQPESEVSAEDYFQEKCILYSVLVELCPDDAQRDVVLRAYAAYLREQNREYKGRIEWILPVKHYLFRLREKTTAETQKSLDPWLTSNDAALRAYAELTLSRAKGN